MAPFPHLSRRGLLALLGGATGAAVATGCSDANNSSPPAGATAPPRDRIPYASDHPDQYGVLALPEGVPARALVVLLHGGYWFAEFGADLMEPMAADLRRRGFATWNVEYRRIGGGGGFPETFEDVAAAMDHVPNLDEVAGLPVHVIGHSAGGHLAGWAASRTAATPGGSPRTVPTSTLSLSGVLDLTAAAQTGLGGGAAVQLMGAQPEAAPEEYAVADPSELVPPQGELFAVHAEEDQIVPVDQSRGYAALAPSRSTLVLVPGGHFDVIDPESEAWEQIVALLP